MKCRVCGKTLESQPICLQSFGRNHFLKDLPVLRWKNYGEYAAGDPVMEKVDFLLANRVQANRVGIRPIRGE